jgi:hypothetical protein
LLVLFNSQIGKTFVDALNPFFLRTYRRLCVEFKADVNTVSENKQEKAKSPETTRPVAETANIDANLQNLIMEQMQRQNELLKTLQTTMDVELPNMTPKEVKKEPFIPVETPVAHKHLSLASSDDDSSTDSPMVIKLPIDLFKPARHSEPQRRKPRLSYVNSANSDNESDNELLE